MDNELEEVKPFTKVDFTWKYNRVIYLDTYRNTGVEINREIRA